MSKQKQKTIPNLGDGITALRGSWSFGGNIPQNFVEHVERSIPFYHEGHELVCNLSDYFVRDNSVCYELGVSTGQLLYRLANHHSHKSSVRWIGIDREENMIAEARVTCKKIPNVELHTDDILLFEFEKSDLIVAYYTISFVLPQCRQDMITKIYETLNWGGAFILFEKVRGPDARFQDILTGLHTNYKLEQGYSAEEIIAKADSLKGVMEPFSTQGNLDLLSRAGFVDVMTVFKNVCFEGFLAIK